MEARQCNIMRAVFARPPAALPCAFTSSFCSSPISTNSLPSFAFAQSARRSTRLGTASALVERELSHTGCRRRDQASHRVQSDWRLTSAAIICKPHSCRRSRPRGDSLDAATSQARHSSARRSQRGRIHPGRRSASASSSARRQPATTPAQGPLMPRTMRAQLRSARAMCHASSSTRRSSGVDSALRSASSARTGTASRTPEIWKSRPQVRLRKACVDQQKRAARQSQARGAARARCHCTLQPRHCDEVRFEDLQVQLGYRVSQRPVKRSGRAGLEMWRFGHKFVGGQARYSPSRGLGGQPKIWDI